MQDAYGGLLSADQFAADFANYAQTVVAALGERVTYYTTINEPDTICSQGYNQGNFAPGAPLQLSARQHGVYSCCLPCCLQVAARLRLKRRLHTDACCYLPPGTFDTSVVCYGDAYTHSFTWLYSCTAAVSDEKASAMAVVSLPLACCLMPLTSVVSKLLPSYSHVQSLCCKPWLTATLPPLCHAHKPKLEGSTQLMLNI